MFCNKRSLHTAVKSSTPSLPLSSTREKPGSNENPAELKTNKIIFKELFSYTTKSNILFNSSLFSFSLPPLSLPPSLSPVLWAGEQCLRACSSLASRGQPWGSVGRGGCVQPGEENTLGERQWRTRAARALVWRGAGILQGWPRAQNWYRDPSERSLSHGVGPEPYKFVCVKSLQSCPTARPYGL